MSKPKLVSSGSLKLVWRILAHEGKGSARFHVETYKEAEAQGWISYTEWQGWSVSASGATAATTAARLGGWK